MTRLALLATLLVGCGRFAFAPQDGSSDGATDTTSLDGTSACAFDLCDGFEPVAIDPRWTATAGVSRDTAFAHRGQASVRIRTASVSAGASSYQLFYEHTALATPGPKWIRAWVRLGALPAGMNAMELIHVAQTTGPMEGDYVFVNRASLDVYAQFMPLSMNNSTPPPVATWFCVVFRVVRSTTNGTLELSSDTQPGILMQNVKTEGVPAVDAIAFKIGYATTNVVVNQPAMDVWFDDLIVHSAPVTCAD